MGTIKYFFDKLEEKTASDIQIKRLEAIRTKNSIDGDFLVSVNHKSVKHIDFYISSNERYYGELDFRIKPHLSTHFKLDDEDIAYFKNKYASKVEAEYQEELEKLQNQYKTTIN